MSSKSKIKGSSYERDVAKFLSELYNESFVRVPNSGAYIGGSNSHRKTSLDSNQAKSFKGDIIAPDEWVKFNCECKSYQDFSFHLLYSGKYSQLEAWLEQLLEVEDDGDLNILFFKITRKGQYVAVQSKYTWVMDSCMLYMSPTYGEWIIVEFNSFFKNNQDLVKLYSGSSDTTSNQNNSLLTINT